MTVHPTQSSRSARPDECAAGPGTPASRAVAPSHLTVPLQLPGQATAHPGPIDLSMMYLMHHGFRRDLSAFAAAAHATPVGDREAWRALAERWALLTTVLRHHQRGEDAGLWPALLKRSDSDAQAVLHDLAAEHAQIDQMLERCSAEFERLLVAPEVDNRITLSGDLKAVKATVSLHLDHEETDAIAIVQEVLTVPEWAVIEAQYLTGPSRMRQVRSFVPWVLYDVPAETRRQVLAGAGARHRMIWTMTHGAFERRERRVFRYLD